MFYQHSTAFFTKNIDEEILSPLHFCAYQLEPSNFGNNFEPLARELYPEVEEAMQYLDQFGHAKLTGTGACVFAEVTDEMNVDDILKHAPCKSLLGTWFKKNLLCTSFKVAS